ncbi:MAG: autotransporter outer membrane beta-barrel domain-containing protein [Deltaproteobacteria bacterium]|jgi:hypothetical protein|nr:autotransporter outer membrane beta-barrel domain-containing protein [Deltaproteobacteria bacterium]
MKFSVLLSLGLAFLALGLFATSALARPPAKEDLFRQLDLAQSRQSQLNSSPSAGEGQPVTVVLVPAYLHSHHNNLTTTLDGTPLKSRSGDARLGSLILTATKPINDRFSFGWIYQYTFGKYKGGLLVPNLPAMDGHSEVDLSSHMTGLFTDIYLGQAGALNLSLFVAWDSFSGQETMIFPNGGQETRSIHRRDTRLGSLTAWWTKQFALNDSWDLTPFLGWRTIRACLRGQADWTAPAGTTTTMNSWAHLVSGGFTLNYKGPVNLKLWSGYNQRTKKDNIPGFGSRAIAPGIANLGWMINWNQRVWTYGLGLSRAVSSGLILDLSYNGFKGEDTISHAANLALIWLF